jgi:Prp8 binding protein
MLLTGHQSAVHTLKFSPDGQSLASAGSDKSIFLWSIYGEEIENYAYLKGHRNTVLELFWGNDSETLFTASADKTAAIWDLERQKIIKRIVEHSSYVSSICPSRTSIGDQGQCVTCSDDGTVKVWDLRERESVLTLPHLYPLTSVCFDEKAERVFAGGIDNLIHSWDIRKPDAELFRLMGHRDTITCLRLDPYGSYILSNSMDSTLRVWDIRPFAPMQRCVKVFSGTVHNFEQNLIKCNWNSDGSLVGSGSADRLAYIWDTTSRQLKYKLPGHEGSVNEVAFHPKEPIIASGCSKGKIFLGEINQTTI